MNGAGTKNRENWATWLLESRVRVGLFIFFAIFLIVQGLNVWFVVNTPGGQDLEDLLAGIIVELNGALFDALLFGVVILWVDVQREKREQRQREVQQKHEQVVRWTEELQDYRGWSSDESARRSAGLVRRLIDAKARIVAPDVHLKGVDLLVAFLAGARLSGSNLEGADLTEANLEGADLTEANLKEAGLAKADLKEADLTEANLEGTMLMGANLSEANLERANLERTMLMKANLLRANLKDADLSGANLLQANLSGAFLIEANLSGANFEGADLRGANLCEASNLTRPDKGWIFNTETKFPEGFDPGPSLPYPVPS